MHRLIEDEFINKANSYQYFFNVIRPNSSKGGKSPLEIIQERDNKINPKIALFPVLFLDEIQENMVNQSSTKEAKGGYDLPPIPIMYLI